MKNPFVSFDEKKEEKTFDKMTLNPIKKSDIWQAMNETSEGKTILIRKSGNDIKNQITNILVPKMVSVKSRLETELNSLLTQTGEPPTEDIHCYAIKLDIPYKRYSWEECHFEEIENEDIPFSENEVPNILELENIDVKEWEDVKNSEYVSGDRKRKTAPTKDIPLENEIFGDYVPGELAEEMSLDGEELYVDDFNASANAEQCIAREDYNRLLDKYVKVIIDFKTCKALSNIDERKDYDLTINQIIALQF